MGDYIPKRLARRVRARAGDACEYRKLPQFTQEASFHIDHVHPRADGGKTVFENLALACVSCSLKKSARICIPDPETAVLELMFNPRKELWEDHFQWLNSWRLIGRTPTGRATIEALGMNRPAIVRIRKMWAKIGKFDPSS